MISEKAFGQKIKARREALGIPQKDVASFLNIDQGKVSLLEKGLRRIDPYTELPLLAKLLNKPISWLLDDKTSYKEETSFELFLKECFAGCEFMDSEIENLRTYIRLSLQAHFSAYPELQKKVHKRMEDKNEVTKERIIDVSRKTK